MVQVIFLPEEAFFIQLNSNQQRIFFGNCCTWAAAQWGENRTIAAVAHMDDHVPHLHWSFVPLVTIFNQRSGRFVITLNAKKAVGGSVAVQQLQESFFCMIGAQYELGHKRQPSGAPQPESIIFADKTSPLSLAIQAAEEQLQISR